VTRAQRGQAFAKRDQKRIFVLHGMIDHEYFPLSRYAAAQGHLPYSAKHNEIYYRPSR